MQARAQFRRVFVCKDCDEEATVDPLTKQILAVECPKCGATELWGYEETILQAPEYFYVYPVAEC